MSPTKETSYGNTFTAGDGLLLTGGDFDVRVDGVTLEIVADTLQIIGGAVGDSLISAHTTTKITVPAILTPDWYNWLLMDAFSTPLTQGTATYTKATRTWVVFSGNTNNDEQSLFIGRGNIDIKMGVPFADISWEYTHAGGSTNGSNAVGFGLGTRILNDGGDAAHFQNGVNLNGNWVTANNGTTTVTGTANDDWSSEQTFRINVVSATQWDCYIAGVLQASHTTNVPDEALWFGVFAHNTLSATTTLTVVDFRGT